MVLESLDEVRRAEEQAERAVESARLEAAELVRQARADSERLLEVARRQGYEEGRLESERIIAQARAEAKAIENQGRLRETAISKHAQARMERAVAMLLAAIRRS
ncbi:MAG: hypothetical protein ACYC55_01685 [Candidatus Geothermincolia bacterium]